MDNQIKQKQKIRKEVQSEIQEWSERKVLYQELDSFSKNVNKWSGLPFHPIRNVAAWGDDITIVLGEMILSVINMMSAARFYKDNVPQTTQPSHNDEFLSYYAKNVFVLIETFKDKIGLLVLSLFEDFDPNSEWLADFEKVMKKLKTYLSSSNDYIKFNADLLLKKLSPLGKEVNIEFEFVEEFRNQRIHKMEPRIEIYGKKPFQDWRYLFKIDKSLVSDELIRLDKELSISYPDERIRKDVINGCFIKGELYVDKKLSRLYSYSEIEDAAIKCAKILMSVSADCFKVITPLLTNYEELR